MIATAPTAVDTLEDAWRSWDSFPACPSPLRHPLRALGWLVSLGAGVVSLVIILSVLAAVPIVNLLVLGYMLEGEGRVVRSGRLRDGVPLAGALPRLGAIGFGTWAWLLVVQLVAGAAADAELVDPEGPAAAAWRRATTITAGGVGIHLLLAWFAGGSLAAFLRPLRNARLFVRALRSGTAWSGAADRLGAGLALVRPRHLFSLGLRGFLGAALWLVPPTLLFSAFRNTQRPAALLVTLAGGAFLGLVLVCVPFLQARFAAEGRFAAFREVAAVREIREETGISGAIIAPLGVIDFWFMAENRRVHKTVHHFLLRAEGGELSSDDAEVDSVEWVPLEEMPVRLAYADERRLMGRVQELLADS